MRGRQHFETVDGTYGVAHPYQNWKVANRKFKPDSLAIHDELCGALTLLLKERIPAAKGTDPQERFIENIYFVALHKIFITLGALAILVPVGVIFLCDMSKAQSFCVVVGFSVLFSLLLSLTQELDSHKAWVVVCAFAAVLVTVMVQLVGATSSN